MDDEPRVQLPGWLLAELIPTRPTPVDPAVYGEGPTARALAPPDWSDFVVVWAGEDPEERHIAAVKAPRSLCGMKVRKTFPGAGLRIVECAVCERRLPTRKQRTLDRSG